MFYFVYVGSLCFCHWHVFLDLLLLLDLFPRPLSFVNFLIRTYCVSGSLPVRAIGVSLEFVRDEINLHQFVPRPSRGQVGRKTTNPALFPAEPGRCVRRSRCQFNAY